MRTPAPMNLLIASLPFSRCWRLFLSSLFSMPWVPLLGSSPLYLLTTWLSLAKLLNQPRPLQDCWQKPWIHGCFGEDARSRDFILQAVDYPIQGQALTSYFINDRFSLPCNVSIESFKNTFNVFTFTPPPSTKSATYDEHKKLCMNSVADDIIGQNEKQAAPIKRNTFLGGKQESPTDVLATIGNFFLYCRTLVDFKMHDAETYSLLLHRFSEIATAINNPCFKSLVEPSLPTSPWIPHQLLFFSKTTSSL